MIKEKWITVTAVIGMLLAVAFTLTLSYREHAFAIESRSIEKKYETSLFDKSTIMEVDIQIDEESWNQMLETAIMEEYYRCDITINGTTYQNVGIRPKGNTSLSMVASDNTTDRYSFKIEFDQYITGQTCEGLDKLCLNNLMADATYMKEYISYDILTYMGVPSPLYNYASITVNGEAWGFYLALEAVEESFAERNFGTSYGMLYKPESMGGDAGRMNGAGASALAYVDDEISTYSGIFESAVFQTAESDHRRVIEALKNISSKTDLEIYLDVDAMLRYTVANVFVLNDDGYFGSMLHNYYLYEKNGKLSMLPWDYNLAFGGFQGNSATSLVNRPIDDVVSSGTLEQRPMVGKILEKEEYFKQYYAYLDELVSGYVESGRFEETVSTLRSMIEEYVKTDATAFYDYEEYQKAQETFVEFVKLRAQSIRGQLDGSIPSSAAEQTQDASALLDASNINVQVMGTQGGGRMLAGGEANWMQNMQGMQNQEGVQNPRGMQNQEGMQMPEGMQIPEGMQMPEGMQVPEGMQMPEGMQVPDGMQNSQERMWQGEGDAGETNRQGVQERQFFGGQMADFQGMQRGEASSESSKEAYIWLAVSFLVIIAGLAIAAWYPRRRY